MWAIAIGAIATFIALITFDSMIPAMVLLGLTGIAIVLHSLKKAMRS